MSREIGPCETLPAVPKEWNYGDGRFYTKEEMGSSTTLPLSIRIFGETLDSALKQHIHAVLNANKDGKPLPEMAPDDIPDSFGALVERLAIEHVRAWMLGDKIGLALAAGDKDAVLDLNRKLDLCFKVIRPRLIAAINRKANEAVLWGRSLVEESTKLYSGYEEGRAENRGSGGVGEPDSGEVSMKRHWNYLARTLRHKWLVYVYGRKLGVPALQLIAHDWTKFLPVEWGPYSKWMASGVTWEEKKHSGDPEFDRAWAHHVSRNPHHWQHWCKTGVITELMPEKYALELLADWFAQSDGDIGGVLDKLQRAKLHPVTETFMISVLDALTD